MDCLHHGAFVSVFFKHFYCIKSDFLKLEQSSLQAKLHAALHRRVGGLNAHREKPRGTAIEVFSFFFCRFFFSALLSKVRHTV